MLELGFFEKRGFSGANRNKGQNEKTKMVSIRYVISDVPQKKKVNGFRYDETPCFVQCLSEYRLFFGGEDNRTIFEGREENTI